MGQRSTSPNNEISLASRRRGLRQALEFDKVCPITRGIGWKAPAQLVLEMPNGLCPKCGAIEGKEK